MNKIIISGFTLLLLIPFSSLVHASDSMTIGIQNVTVTEKQFYHIIIVDVFVMKPNMAIDDGIAILPAQLRIVNENGTSYPVDYNECKMPFSFSLSGKTGPNGSFSVCYSVEKKFDKFKMYYTPEYQTPIQIGTIDLTTQKDGNPCARLMTQAEKDANPHRIQDGISGIMVGGKCVTNNGGLNISQPEDIKNNSQNFNVNSFFSQLLEMFKNLFKFS